MTEPTRPCGTCGMPCTPGEYHPYAACLMFKACHNSETVRANLEAVRAAQAQAGEITPPPIECNTEELKRAYAFGWWSALEKQRETAQAGAVPLPQEPLGAEFLAVLDAHRFDLYAEADKPGIKGGQHG